MNLNCAAYRIIVCHEVQRRSKVLPQLRVLCDGIWKDREDPGEEKTSSNSGQAEWRKLVNRIVFLTVRCSLRKANLPHLKLISEDQRHCDLRDYTHRSYRWVLHYYIYPRVQEEKVEDQDTSCTSVYDVIGDEAKDHSGERAQNPQKECT